LNTKVIAFFKQEIPLAQQAAAGNFAAGKTAIDVENKMVMGANSHYNYVNTFVAACKPAPDACQGCKPCATCSWDPHCRKITNGSGDAKKTAFDTVATADITLQNKMANNPSGIFYEPWCGRHACEVPGAGEAKRLSADLQGHVQVLQSLGDLLPGEARSIIQLETQASGFMADAKFYLEKPKGNYGQNLMDAAILTRKAATAVTSAAAIWGGMDRSCTKR
jgi:hypothetical protein